ncbi:MAG TPA: hypothetical protein VL854_02100 [Nitrososphaeraceae archaeon]|nr:hypothetical protein [Nitrososphaeraceae archaeon]
MEKAPKQKEYVIRKDQNTGEISTKQVPNGTLETYKARIVSLKKGISFGGLEVEKLYDLKTKIYSPQRLTGDNLLSFRPPHTQELKTSLANAHESDPYMKRITGFYTDYTFGDRIRPIVMPLMVDPPRSKDENDDMVRKVISKTEHEGFVKFISDVDYMSNIYSVLKGIWHQSYVFGMAAAWKTLSLKELVSVRKGNKVRIPLGTPIDFKPIDGFYLTYIHQDVDTFKPKFYEYLNPNATLTTVFNVNNEPVTELSLRPNTKINNQNNMLPWERLLIVKRPNIGTTPNTSVYGVSPILPSLYISENVRRIDEKILPELNEGSYAGVGIFSVAEDSKYDIDKLAQDLSTAGTRIVMNEEITYTPIQVDFDMQHILDQKTSLIKSELLALGLPESIFFPTNTNRSVLEILINIWQNVDLQKERDTLNTTIWNYWYKDLMNIFFPNEELLDLAITVNLEFKNKTFAGFVDKAAPTIEAFKYGLLNKQEARENIDQEELDDSGEEPFILKLEKSKQVSGARSNISNEPSRTAGVRNSGDVVSSATKVSSNTSRSRSTD